MNLLAVTLVLAVLTGSQASVLREDLEHFHKYLDEYSRNISRAIDDEEDLFDDSKVARMIKDYAHERFSNISQHLRKLLDELAETMPGELKQVLIIPARAVEMSYNAVSKYLNRMEQPTEELYAALRPVVAPHAKPILEELRTHAETFLSELQEEDEEEAKWMKSEIQRLDALLSPTVKEVLRGLQEFQEALQSLADMVEEQVRKDVRCATEALKPYVTPILKPLQDYIQAMRK